MSKFVSERGYCLYTSSVVDGIDTMSVTPSRHFPEVCSYSKKQLILGRDKLGRLMYPGDVRVANWFGEPIWARMIRPDWRVDRISTVGYTCPPSFIEIDLEASPKMTNYDRYFAEYGTVIQVIGFAHETLFDTDGIEFWDSFKELFGVGFASWLNMKATV